MANTSMTKSFTDGYGPIRHLLLVPVRFRAVPVADLAAPKSTITKQAIAVATNNIFWFNISVYNLLAMTKLDH